jgi:aryl carrier-like protein
VTADVPPPRVLDRFADAVAELLGRPLRPEENFFDAGLDSLALVTVYQQVTADLGDAFPVTELFAHPNLVALRQRLSDGGRPAWNPGSTRTAGNRVQWIGQQRRNLRRGRGNGEGS